LDPDANWMAAFTRKDPTDEAAFYAHWAKIQADAGILNRTILVDGQVAGHIASFDWSSELELTYWLGREFWGQGLATAALRLFLVEQPTRPLAARAASDNAGSRRVLEKCGFRPVGTDRGYANARAATIEETIYRLEE
ncbi:MAG: GNAT family N-acetyltransferase, partial [Anaerolineales bacterium]|nr:GNAT family N-acetyltransferase [Anaerolineales bacterium]